MTTLLSLADPTTPLALEGLLPWIGVFLLVTTAIIAWAALTAVRRLEALREETRAMGRLEDLQRTLASLSSSREGLDLRRIEHLLIDLREGFERLESVLLRLHEGEHRPTESLAVLTPQAPVGERVTTRLLALGYERIRVVTPPDELAAAAAGDGQVVVEARREGTLCKGRVTLRQGHIEAVHLEPTYSAFP
jgi:hypothetical protein